MRHKIKALVETEKRGLFGKKKVYKYRTIKVDGKTYRKMRRAMWNRPFSIEEMIFYDAIWGD